ncbi:hypothetical protein BSPWISOX_2010 [uncultured Gammaproteobacteria bacterium]|nr:hypothetical protein BSPWISOX_2010 [uncultured Gammaproteobacteria bacterium]
MINIGAPAHHNLNNQQLKHEIASRAGCPMSPAHHNLNNQQLKLGAIKARTVNMTSTS